MVTDSYRRSLGSRLSMTACLLLLVASCAEQQEPVALESVNAAGVQPVDVSVHELQKQTWQGTVSTFGVVEALEEVNVAAELSGTVTAVYVNEGDRVTAGQLLLELDPEKRQIAVEQADQQVQRAQVALEETRQKLKRRLNLAAKETISKEVLDNAQLAVDGATAGYQQAVASQQLAQRELADTRIYSPTAGLVDIKAVEAGEPVQAGASLITLQAVQSLRVHTWVSESDIAHIQAGGHARVFVSGLVGREFPARIAWVGVNADPRTGNFPVKLILSDAVDSLRPGMTARAVLDGIRVPDALLLPESALVDRNRRRVVFVVEAGVARMREPVLAAGFNNRLQVLRGLSPGDQIVTDGQASLLDGTVISIRDGG